MIDAKYAVKYPMPHSVVHIVDNSEAAETARVQIADDPSMLSTIVVTGAPMGEDNKIITLTRSDVVNTAFGMGNISVDDINKYGQGITYASSLISQGVPVRFMRVTPDGSKYAAACMVVQWRSDDTDGKIHVRFKVQDWPEDLPREKFANTARLNEALIKQFKNDNVSSDGATWKQRVFITFVGAGRGSAYNYMIPAINLTQQAKRPTNVKYEFLTIDSRDDMIIEKFYASLMNISTGAINAGVQRIDSVNTAVAKRVPGSSIVVPYLNESAVREVYEEYIQRFKEKIETGQADAFAQQVYKVMNINIFDMVFGNYIYNGTDTAVKMPYYQVDMIDTDIPKLPESNIVCSVLKNRTEKFDPENPTVVYNKIKGYTSGVANGGETVYVGDMYMTTTGTSASLPKIQVVTSINQYTGTVSTLTIPRVYALVPGSGDAWDTLDTSISKVITKLYPSRRNEAGQDLVALDAARGDVKDGDVIAIASTTEGFELDIISVGTDDAVTLHKYPATKLYAALDRTSHSGGVTGTGNAIAWTSSDAAWNRIGATVIVGSDTDPKIYVNDYARNADDSGDTDNRILVANASRKVGNPPSEVVNKASLAGEQFDVKVYNDDSIEKWRVSDMVINNAGTGYEVGQLVYIPVANDTPKEIKDDSDKLIGIDTTNTRTIIKVTSVNAAGGVVTFDVIKSDSYTATASTSGTVVDAKAGTILNTTITSAIVPEVVEGASGPEPSTHTGENMTVDIVGVYSTQEKDSPVQIKRFIVVGSVGSLYRVQYNPVEVPANYYSNSYGINPTSAVTTIKLSGGSTGFFDKADIHPVQYKWYYSQLLTSAFRGNIDPRIMSPTRVPAKFLFDAGYNTIIGSTIVAGLQYPITDIIQASIIFTDDEKEETIFDPTIVSAIDDPIGNHDIDVKAAMYDLMMTRIYDGIPEDKRPIGPGSGMSLHLDAGVTDATTAKLINTSFNKRFDNPNASWDIGGIVDIQTGVAYTFTKKIVDNLMTHIQNYSINKPFVGKYSAIQPDEYASYFPDIDATDWDLRELFYNSGGNAWIADRNGVLTRRSQRTLIRDTETSDLLQESNMRTLSRLVYILQDKIDSYLLEYNNDSVLKTLSDEVNNMFSNWVGNLVDDLQITFERDRNVDGGEILVCYCNVTFRGLILRVPIIVNVNRRD